MALPDPRPGLVFRYDYLWSRESISGRDQGKERPACLVAASDPATKPRFVVILPITHSPPSGDTIGIEIPPRVRQAIGLDDAPCWVVVSEHNVDEWRSRATAGPPQMCSVMGLSRLRCSPRSGSGFWRWLSKAGAREFADERGGYRPSATPPHPCLAKYRSTSVEYHDAPTGNTASLKS